MRTFFTVILADWVASLVGGLVGFRGLILLFFIVGGGFLGYGAWLKQSTANRLESLSPISGYDLDRADVGREVLVVGHTGRQNPVLFRDFIAYVAEEYHGRDDDGNEIWKEVARQSPPLWVVVTDGPVRLRDYRQLGSHEVWYTTPKPQQSGRNREATLRYNGLLSDAPIMAIGKVVREGTERTIEAGFLFGGTVDAYLAFIGRDVRSYNIVGAFWLGGGVFFLLLQGFFNWQDYRRKKNIKP